MKSFFRYSKKRIIGYLLLVVLMPVIFILSGCTMLQTPPNNSGLWIVNQGDNAIVEFNQSELSFSGTPIPNLIITGNTIDQPTCIAFDYNRDLWIANEGNNTIVEIPFPEYSNSQSSRVMTSALIDEPTGIAFDYGGNLWIANSGNNTIVEFTPIQLSIGGNQYPNVILYTNYNDSSIFDPFGIAFDLSDDLWVANGNNTVVEFNQSELSASGDPLPTVIESAQWYANYNYGNLAFDSNGDMWESNGYGAIVEFTPSELLSSYSEENMIMGTNLSGPSGITFDSNDDLWIANKTNNDITEVTPSNFLSDSYIPSVVLFSNSNNLVNEPIDVAFGPAVNNTISK